MKILFATNQLWSFTGSEMTLLGLAQACAARGHQVACHAQFISPRMLTDLQRRGLKLIEAAADLASDAPDVVYCQHHPVAAAVRRRLPTVPMVLAHLGVEPELEQAPLVNCAIEKHLAISEEARDLLIRQGIDPQRIVMFRNAVRDDLFEPFAARNDKALLFSYKIPAEWKGLLKQAAADSALEFDGESLIARGHLDPEELAQRLRGSKLVFASGRSALEAALAGAAVVILGPKGLDGALTVDSIDVLAQCNFSGRRHAGEVTPETLRKAIAQALSADHATVRAQIVETFGLVARSRELEQLLLAALSSPVRPDAASSATVHRFDELLDEQRRMAVWQNKLVTRGETAQSVRALNALLRQGGVTGAIDALDPRTLLSEANAAWQAQNSDEALSKYATAFILDRTSAETSQQFVSALLVHLGTLHAKQGKVAQRKTTLAAFLRLQPSNAWAIGMLIKLSANPCDPLMFRELLELAPRWNDEARASARSMLLSLDRTKACAEADRLLHHLESNRGPDGLAAR